MNSKVKSYIFVSMFLIGFVLMIVYANYITENLAQLAQLVAKIMLVKW